MKVLPPLKDRLGFHGALVLACLLAIFLAGGIRELGFSIVLLTAGAVLLCCRPSASVSPFLWIIGLGITFCGFLPLILPTDPAMTSVLNASVPGHLGAWPLSVEPATTAFWAVLLTLTVLLALFLLSSPPADDRLEALAVLIVAGTLVYGLISLSLWKSGMPLPGWLKEPGTDSSFGLFPNRNHTAGFLVTGTILSAGLLVEAMANGRVASALMGAISLPVLVSLLLGCSRSRAGLLFLLVGLVIWFVGLGRQRPKWLSFGATAFALILMVLFVTSGSPLLKRFLSSDPSEGGGGPRFEIAKDTIEMAAPALMTGHGMGTFPLLYPQVAKASLRYATTALHPESDWLLLLHDDGMVAVVLLLAGVVLCFIPMPKGLDSCREWPLRWAMASAFLAEVLHSLIDVPLHRIELGWWVLLFGGFSVSGWLAKGKPLRWQSVIFKSGGVLLLGIGLWMLLSVFGLVRPAPPFESMRSREKLLKMYGVVSYGEAAPVLAECERLLASYPLNTDLAHQYATFLIQEKTDPDRARSLFALERRLLPNDGDIVFQQGWILIDEDPSETVSLWKEALARQSRMDSLPGNPVPRISELFRSMMQVASEHRSMDGRMGEVAICHPETRLLWILAPACPVADLESASRDQAFMDGLTSSQRGQVFEALWTRGSRPALKELIEKRYPLAPESVPVRSRFLADSGKADEACRLLVSSYAVPLPHPPGTSTILPAGNDVPKDPLEAARYYLGIGNSIAARRYLEEARGGATGAPGEFYLVAANVAMEEGKWPEALQMLLAFLGATGKR